MPEPDERSVADVNRLARSLIEAETLEHFFWLSGRVEGYKKSDRGHIYFRLHDEGKSIRCVLYEDKAGDLNFELRNGLSIEVYGYLRFYEAWGNIEIKAQRVRLSPGQKAAIPAVERLRAEGLYPPRKQQPPRRIRRIGIITSRSSASIGDFENAYRTAADGITLPPYDFHYAFVEGERAPRAVADAINMLNKDAGIDLIAIIRGGARTEALAIFDDIRIARAILKSGTFVVTGIGHHRDRTLADEVADHSVSTPTAVAHYIAGLCTLRAASTAVPQQSKAARHARIARERPSALPSDPAARAEIPATMDQRQPQEQAPTSVRIALIVLALAAFLLLAVFVLGELWQ